MINIQTLDLTEKDFDLIIAGLDHLPQKSLAGDMITDLMSTIIEDKLPDDRNAQSRFEMLKRDRDKKAKMREAEKKDLVEDVRILQGKLLILKRYLKQEGALKEATDIITKQ